MSALNHLTADHPTRGRRVPGNEIEQVVGAILRLKADVDVPMTAWRIPAGPARTARKVVTLDPQLYRDTATADHREPLIRRRLRSTAPVDQRAGLAVSAMCTGGCVH
jgi:hypothetical protein